MVRSGSSRHGGRAKKSDERIAGLTLKELENLPSATDWERVKNLTDDEIEAAMRDDPDWADPIDMDWSDAVLVVPMKKKAISIRLDEDVIDFFKAKGEGYQTRMNAALRHYMNRTKKPDAAE
jgi:uncharacterized protein (DUF4415 family)